MRSSKIDTWVLGIGEARVTHGEVMFKCYGLGSCVGLFLYDPLTSNAAGAHIMLPGRHEDMDVSPTSFCLDAIEFMVTELKRIGSQVKDLRAKIVGGANVANIHTIKVGLENIESVKSELMRKQIPITSMNVGGTFVRSAEFSSVTKELTVTSIDCNNVFSQTLISTTYA